MDFFKSSDVPRSDKVALLWNHRFKTDNQDTPRFPHSGLQANVERKKFDFLLEESMDDLKDMPPQEIYNLFCLFEESLTFFQKREILGRVLH